MTFPDLSVLLERVARKDRAAFTAVYDLTSAKLYGIVLRIVRRRELADEVVQEVYVRVWEQADRFDRSKGSAIAWLATLARNRAIDEIRAGRHETTTEDGDVFDVADDARSALETLEATEDLLRLKSCLEGLEPERRNLVVAAYLTGASREALANGVGAPVGTIKTWLRRSLKQLKDCLMS